MKDNWDWGRRLEELVVVSPKSAIGRLVGAFDRHFRSRGEYYLPRHVSRAQFLFGLWSCEIKGKIILTGGLSEDQASCVRRSFFESRSGVWERE
jgi:hypothetical protein